MAASDKPLKVLIGGGGVAGLALANMLERFEIDYLLLEAHSEIAPGVGASIGMFPNGLRILDQIDCYEPLRGFMDSSDVVSHTLDKSGRPVASVPSFQKHVELRHGYPLMFFDRQWLLQSLYDHLRLKDQVLLNKSVTRIDLVDGGVEATTADGATFRGSLIVGADGVHSAVRREMYRMGDELEPGYFPPGEQDRVPCHYLCSFGIAQHVPGWEPGDQCTVLGNGHSQLVVSGPQHRVYWFFFSKLQETKYGKDIPRYDKETETLFIKKYAHVPITQKVTFGQVYAKRLSSALTPLHEFVLKKWFFKRMVIFGDSVHKPNPIGGQGGNGAIESAAEFVNALLRKKDSRSGSLTALTDKDIEDIFTEMQTARHERAERIVFASHMHQSLVAYEKPLISAFVWELMVPLMGSEASLALFGLTMMRSTRLKKLPLKSRPRAIPFNDELPAPPLKSVRPVQIVFTMLMGYLLSIAVKAARHSTTTSLDIWSGTRINRQLVSTFSFANPKEDPEGAVLALYFLSQLASPILIYVVEGYRLGNRGTILALPSLFLVVMQIAGIGRTAPIYAILHAFLSHSLPTGRFIRSEVASVLLPALTLGYWLPTVLMAAPTLSSHSRQAWAAVWPFAPPFVCILVHVLRSTSLFRNHGEMAREDKEERQFDRYRGQDAPVLKSVYRYTFAMQASTHFAILMYAHHHSIISIKSIMFGLLSFFQSGGNISRVKSRVTISLWYDMAIAVAVWLLGNLYAIWNLRRLGYIKTRDVHAPVLGIMAGQILVGPGATWVGLWYWREGVLSELKRD